MLFELQVKYDQHGNTVLKHEVDYLGQTTAVLRVDKSGKEVPCEGAARECFCSPMQFRGMQSSATRFNAMRCYAMQAIECDALHITAGSAVYHFGEPVPFSPLSPRPRAA